MISMYYLRSTMYSTKFLSQGVIMKYLFCLSLSNTLYWSILKLPICMVLLFLYRVHSSLDKFSRHYYTYRNYYSV